MVKKKKVVKTSAKDAAAEVAVPSSEQEKGAAEKVTAKRKRSASTSATATADGEEAKASTDVAEKTEEVQQPLGSAAKRRKKAKKAAERKAAGEGKASHEPEEKKVEDSQGEAASATATGHTVFVDGVPYEWTKEKVEEYFQQCGDVIDVNAAVWQDSGRLRGYAHVTFGTAAGQKAALALSGSKVGKKGRYLKIEAAKGHAKQNSAPSAAEVVGMKRLFVKNLPYDTNEAELGDVFKQCGKIREIRIPTSFGRVKGFAYIEFSKSEGLQAAVSLAPAPSIRGRQLVLDCDQGKGPKSGFHFRPEAYDSGYGPKAQKGAVQRLQEKSRRLN
mmetsp:Transcript_65371/g.156299  ORF Transcript_65371/g.156299 Transcript_65371/m.156299 type:complete len:331 (+) Transcript_65371:107-1099(+)